MVDGVVVVVCVRRVVVGDPAGGAGGPRGVSGRGGGPPGLAAPVAPERGVGAEGQTGPDRCRARTPGT
ncbi:hypothetical protein JTE90_024193 [Oedothorax gibbosus]|uniref:Uncharacterized protein n=1 Tax=Oedothorax gibbosus TaxID=931172 RepID=A0AAV6UDU8_9ARAC|nr:hypothetical protein JTE90_024193 [Oedothorax gibbosus]